MKISDSVRALLNMNGKKQADLVKPLGMKSAASLNNKFSYDRWDAKDLVKVAYAMNCRIGFQLPSGDMLYLDPDEYILKEDNDDES